jgi:hypothetical protein
MTDQLSLQRFSQLLAALKEEMPALRGISDLLELGCGVWADRSALREAFPAAQLYGVDRVLLPIGARRLGTRSLFIQADIRALPFSTMPARWPLIIIRHPDVDRWHAAWHEVVPLICTMLRPGGAVLVTTYFVGEATLINRWFGANPAMKLHWVFPAHASAHNHKALTDLVGNDRHYLVYQREAA